MSAIIDIVLAIGVAVVIVGIAGVIYEQGDIGPCRCRHCREVRR